MRAAVGVSVALAACCLAVVAAQTPQAPVFRSGVEVLEVDVSVVDAQGKPLRDLQAGEFSVSVDGQPRRVVSSEYISDVSAESQLAGITVDPDVSNNTDRRPGRLIVLVIDQNNMTMERLLGALDSTKKFIAGLASNDRVALMAIPSPGPLVEFTTNPPAGAGRAEQRGWTRRGGHVRQIQHQRLRGAGVRRWPRFDGHPAAAGPALRRQHLAAFDL